MGDRRTEAAISEKLLARDEDTFRAVVDRYSGVVFAMARRVVAEPRLAEEVAQDTFMVLWRRPGAFDPERGSLQAWLVSVARNKAIDLVRSEESLKRTKESLVAQTNAESTESGVQIDLVDETQEIKGVLRQLSAVQREAIVLAYFGGRTYREVADELQIPVGTAKTRLRDGLIRMRKLMTNIRET